MCFLNWLGAVGSLCLPASRNSSGILQMQTRQRNPNAHVTCYHSSLRALAREDVGLGVLGASRGSFRALRCAFAALVDQHKVF